MLVLDLTVWGKLDNWRVSVTSNNFEEVDSSIINLLSEGESADG